MDDSIGRRRRTRRSPQQWARIVAGWSGSGLSAEEYAKREDVGVDSLWRWAGRLRREGVSASSSSTRRLVAPGAGGPKFLAVEVTEGRPTAPRAAEGRGSIEVSWPGGPTVRLSGEVAPATLAAVLRAVTEVTPC